MKDDEDLKGMSFEEFCASEYHDPFIELFKRGWTEAKLAAAYDAAIVTWQREGFEGKPPLKLLLQALLDGAADDILFEHYQSLS